MEFKYYFRKSSFKKDQKSAKILIKQIEYYKPKNFLEVGVFQGVTARNVCEKLYLLNKNNFKYYGIDIFEHFNKDLDKKEMTTKHNNFSNPIKDFLFNIVLKQDLNSLKSVKKLLKKFKNNVYLYKGLSNFMLPKIEMKNIDFIFLDGGHSYETVKNDLNLIIKNIQKNKVIICDDYDQIEYGVKKAVDELSGQVNVIENLNKRLVKIIT